MASQNLVLDVRDFPAQRPIHAATSSLAVLICSNVRPSSSSVACQSTNQYLSSAFMKIAGLRVAGRRLQSTERSDSRLDQKCQLIVQAESGKAERIPGIRSGQQVNCSEP